MSNRAPSARRRPGAPGHPAVDGVEDQRDGGARPAADIGAGPASRVDDQRGHDAATSVARASVTRSAGPSRRAGRPAGRGRAAPLATSTAAPMPTSQPAAAQTRRCAGERRPSSTTWRDQPERRAGSNRAHRACRPWVSRTRTPDTDRCGWPRFTRGLEEDAAGVARGARVLAARARAWARSGRCRCPSPGRTTSLVRTLRSGVSRGTETLVFRGRCPGEPVRQRCGRRSRRATSPGRSSTATSTSASSRHGPAAAASGAPCSASTRTRPPTSCRPSAVTVVPDGVPAGAGRAGRHGRDRGQRAVGRRAAGRRPGRRRRRRHGRLLRRAAARPDPRRRGDPRRRRPGPGRGRRGARASTSPRRTSAAGGRDLVVHASATSAGLQLSLDLLAPEGTVIELSWYGDARGAAVASAARSTPAGCDPGQPGRHGRAGPPRRPDAPPTGWRSRSTCCATPRSTRCSPGRRRFDELPDVMARLADRRSLPALCHTITYGEGWPMFSVTVRDHMMIAHSFRGEVFGPAQRLHGATFVVDATFRRADARRRQHRRRHRPGGRASCARSLARAELPQPRRRAGVRRRQHHHRGARPGDRRPARRAGPRRRARRGRARLTGIAVTLHESHVAWASYERDL